MILRQGNPISRVLLAAFLTMFAVGDVVGAPFVETISLGPSTRPVAIAVNQATNKVYVADHANGRLIVIDGTDNAVIGEIPVSGQPIAVAVSMVTNRVYVVGSRQFSDTRYLLTRTLIDGASDVVLTEFPSPFPGPAFPGPSGRPMESASIAVSEARDFVLLIVKYFNVDAPAWRGASTCLRLDFASTTPSCPGTTSCVVFLTDQTFNFTLPDGSTAPASVSAGALGCGDENIHLPENTAAEPAEFIMVEFKDRDRFQR